jgi:S-DNA-T family DNA segregation ATPase FtsK/SpoIIIE
MSEPCGDELVRGMREVALLVLTALALFFLISLATFSLDDPGWSSSGTGAEIKNAGGAVGAWISDFFLTVFGVMAFLFPVMIGYRGVVSYRGRKSQRIGWKVGLRWFGFVMTILGGASLVYAHFLRIRFPLPETTGGLVGEQFGQALINSFGLTGATLLLVAGFLAGVTLCTGFSWIALVDWIGKYTLILLDWFGRMAAAVPRILLASTTRSRDLSANLSPTRRAKKGKSSRRPKIDPVLAPIKTSGRAEKERQGDLFGAMGGSLPKLSLLDEYPSFVKGYSKSILDSLSRKVEAILRDFGVDVEVVGVHPGPVITRFELKPAAGVKVSRISGLSKDLARALSVCSVRIVEVIPGKSVIGLEIPNQERETVSLREVLSSQAFEGAISPMTLVLGKDIGGKPVIADLAKMPHLLVAGTTGSGKSVAINAMILSLLYKSTPADIRMIMIDPKMLELSVYEGIPHLLTPVVTDMKEAANALRWCVAEMERRYKLMASLGVRNLAGYNRKIKDARAAGEPLLDPFWKPDEYLANDEQERPELDTLPFIVVVIDEFADMMMIVGKKVEELIARIAQKARAAGIHLILATQRPSVDVITGLIKANIPTRMSFQVSSKIDSRTVLDQGGAEQLLGHGDMLYLPPGSGLPVRVHGAFVDDDEVHRVVSAWKARGEPVYVDDVLNGAEGESLPGVPNLSEGGGDSEVDALYDEAVAFVTEGRRVSISSVQRKFKIGYNRAANLVDAMEASGVVSAAGHNGAREVLAPPPPRD